MNHEHYKKFLIDNYDNFQKVKELLATMDSNYFTTTTINERELNEATISIVMTACNRSQQTCFTLDTISKSSYKNVQVIIVDDSTDDYLSISVLERFNLHIELIQIKNKFWVNPCVNYNIAFNHIKGGKVIIQNAEVCHVGDIIDYVNSTVIDDNYYTFNVCALEFSHKNPLLYAIKDMTLENRNKIVGISFAWYQHIIYYNKNNHFLTALTFNTFNKIKGFDIDYAMGIEYDDNDLVNKIIQNNIPIINVNNELMGVHQWHRQSASGSYSGKTRNDKLFYYKNEYFKIYNKVINFTDYSKEEATDIINKIKF